MIFRNPLRRKRYRYRTTQQGDNQVQNSVKKIFIWAIINMALLCLSCPSSFAMDENEIL
ncbi:conserved hypothetical protein [delta proteobacterium NaphS2]|nr:conserved hypothetical protein [delta proteobacterium NaphS2]